MSGNEYVVASRGDGSYYTYLLAEKVWMALGLTPRCIGGDQQKIIFDDLSLPEIGVAEGEVSNEYYWSPKRDVSWRITNEYLRKYLWMRGYVGVRVFFYEKLFDDGAELRAVMKGQTHYHEKPDNGWYEIDIREFKAGILVQVWASVAAVSPELCAPIDVYAIVWPDDDQPLTKARASNSNEEFDIFLDDKFLERYEQSAFYDTVPVLSDGQWYCSPSYRGQWSFTGCRRVGRNLIRVTSYELYKPKPPREILHARNFALSAAEVAGFDQTEEPIVSKVQRLLDELLEIGSNLGIFGGFLGQQRRVADLCGFSYREVRANGWLRYPILQRLGQAAPLDMSQQAFLARCKTLHEVLQKIPNGFLKFLLQEAGCDRAAISQLGSFKLLQALFNILTFLNQGCETSDAFKGAAKCVDWAAQAPIMAPLFLNNDLRIADAHEAIAKGLASLESMGFDTAQLNAGYGRALDFVMDGVIDALRQINNELGSLIVR